MDPFAFTTVQEGILIAERALDELRVFLHTTSGADGIALGSSNRAPPVAFHSGDRIFALREQLDNLEEMLRMITDARFARTLIEDENERATVGDMEDGENLDLLRVIIMTIQEVMAIQTYDGFDPLPNDQDDTDDAALSGRRGAGPLSDPVVVNNVQINIPRAGRRYDDREPPPSPLNQLSDELEFEPETEPAPVVPNCLGCAELLSLPTGHLETPCGHFYCPGCADNLVELYTSQPFPSDPLRCCPAPHPSIPPRFVFRFISDNKRVTLEEKIVEAETPYDRRIYCPQDTCRKFIDPARITPAARLTGSVTCPNATCRVSVCLGCRQPVHRGVGCEKNADDMQAVRIQKQFGWGRCPGCGFVVEKVDGCSSVSCSRCGKGFTYQPMAQN